MNEPLPVSAPSPSFPYRLETLVGEGSMGTVYRATELVLERPVAVKFLRAELADDRRNAGATQHRLRFLQEAKAAAALSHPNVTTLLRTGEERGQPYLVMEWLEGRTLEERVQRLGPVPVAQVARLASDLLAALGAAHRLGIVHRDIKPSNLFELADGRLKVMDFGIARLLSGELVKTQAGTIFATPLYASPEQLRGEEVDARSDLFSAGSVLYYLLTGKAPFEGSDPQSGADYLRIAHRILYEEPEPLERLRPEVPAGLAQVLRRALAKRREQRFASAAEMAEALTGADRPSPVTVSGPPAPRRAPELVAARADRAPEQVREAVRRWPARSLGEQNVQSLLDRLLETPLHAPPFAGALELGGALVLVADGAVLAALDEAGEGSGDAVLERLPASGVALLRSAPEPEAARLVAVLASLVGSRRVRHADLDASFVNLPALGTRLAEEGFDGVLTLERPGAVARVLWVAGEVRLTLFAGDWLGLPLDRPWQELVAAVAVRATVEEATVQPLAASFRRQLAGATWAVEGGRVTVGAGGTAAVLPMADPTARFVSWALAQLPAHLAERGRAAGYKYLVEWLADVTAVQLYQRPDGAAGPLYDAATVAADGRLLHLVRRVARADEAVLQRFVADVTATKTARLKTGDIGGAILVAGSLTPELAQAQRQAKSTSSSGRWFAVEESFTGYEGFIRVGPRRGFHLLVVEETPEGYRPVLR